MLKLFHYLRHSRRNLITKDHVRRPPTTASGPKSWNSWRRKRERRRGPQCPRCLRRWLKRDRTVREGEPVELFCMLQYSHSRVPKLTTLQCMFPLVCMCCFLTCLQRSSSIGILRKGGTQGGGGVSDLLNRCSLRRNILFLGWTFPHLPF